MADVGFEGLNPVKHANMPFYSLLCLMVLLQVWTGNGRLIK